NGHATAAHGDVGGDRTGHHQRARDSTQDGDLPTRHHGSPPAAKENGTGGIGRSGGRRRFRLVAHIEVDDARALVKPNSPYRPLAPRPGTRATRAISGEGGTTNRRRSDQGV